MQMSPRLHVVARVVTRAERVQWCNVQCVRQLSTMAGSRLSLLAVLYVSDAVAAVPVLLGSSFRAMIPKKGSCAWRTFCISASVLADLPQGMCVLDDAICDEKR